MQHSKSLGLVSSNFVHHPWKSRDMHHPMRAVLIWFRTSCASVTPPTCIQLLNRSRGPGLPKFRSVCISIVVIIIIIIIIMMHVYVWPRFASHSPPTHTSVLCRVLLNDNTILVWSVTAAGGPSNRQSVSRLVWASVVFARRCSIHSIVSDLKQTQPQLSLALAFLVST